MDDYDPFQALGLPARPDLPEDEVRAAWRRIAASTHPDRPDGGDPARFAAAAAAYATLRTGYGRGEAYADLREDQAAGPPRLRWREGRPAILMSRVVLATAVCWAAIAVAGWQPATLAITVGALTWLVRTARYDLPRGRRGGTGR